MSAHLAHLTAVVAPFESSQLEALSEDQVSDMWEEGVALCNAVKAFQEQMQEVTGLLNGVLVGRGRKGRRNEVEG